MERREYSRARVNLMANFIVEANDPGLREFSGKIFDISETGLRIEIEKGSYENILLTLNEGANVAFQAVDEYELYNELVTDVFQGKAEIVRIEQNHDSTVLGCRVTYHEEDFDEYVMNKKLSIFISERK